MRREAMKLVSGTWAEWPARDSYCWATYHAPSFMLGRWTRRGRDFDRLTVQVAASALATGGCFVDAGANAGQILRHLVKLAPSRDNWAFEPVPRLAAHLRRRFPGVCVEEAALSDYEGTAEFRFYPDDPAFSTLHARPEIEAGRSVRILPVRVRPLDACLPTDMRVAFIKLDVEGAEAEALRGMTRTLKTWQPVVVFECLPGKLPECLEPLEAAGLHASFLDAFSRGENVGHAELVRASAGRDVHYFAAAPIAR